MSVHGASTALNREFLGSIYIFSLFIIILFLSVHEKHKRYIVWEHVVPDHGAATALNRQKQKNCQGKPCLSLYEDMLKILSYGKAYLRLCISSMS